mmetsp:Transcript_88295/g.285814  ORF Transcript_88295/g.285814 Transcript_88295/m.285814 type:complete len:302 (+) Transcript_88295:496-1401(+)
MHLHRRAVLPSAGAGVAGLEPVGALRGVLRVAGGSRGLPVGVGARVQAAGAGGRGQGRRGLGRRRGLRGLWRLRPGWRLLRLLQLLRRWRLLHWLRRLGLRWLRRLQRRRRLLRRGPLRRSWRRRWLCRRPPVARGLCLAAGRFRGVAVMAALCLLGSAFKLLDAIINGCPLAIDGRVCIRASLSDWCGCLMPAVCCHRCGLALKRLAVAVHRGPPAVDRRQEIRGARLRDHGRGALLDRSRAAAAAAGRRRRGCGVLLWSVLKVVAVLLHNRPPLVQLREKLAHQWCRTVKKWRLRQICA